MKYAVAVFIACLVVLAPTAFSSAPVKAPQTGPILLVGRVVEHHVYPRVPVGRETYFWSLQSSRRAGRPFGYGSMSCTFVTEKSSLRECTGTFSLPRGRITTGGSFFYTKIFLLAVTGGTELYSRSSGYLQVRAFPGTAGTSWFTFELQ